MNKYAIALAGAASLSFGSASFAGKLGKQTTPSTPAPTSAQKQEQKDMNKPTPECKQAVRDAVVNCGGAVITTGLASEAGPVSTLVAGSVATAVCTNEAIKVNAACSTDNKKSDANRNQNETSKP